MIYYFYRIKDFIQMVPRRIKWFFQRGFRGYSDNDQWNLCFYLSSWLPDALEQLKETGYGFPASLITDETVDDKIASKQWNEILKTMADGFRAFNKLDTIEYESEEEEKELIRQFDKGMLLFSKHFSNLWD